MRTVAWALWWAGVLGTLCAAAVLGEPVFLVGTFAILLLPLSDMGAPPW